MCPIVLYPVMNFPQQQFLFGQRILHTSFRLRTIENGRQRIGEELQENDLFAGEVAYLRTEDGQHAPQQRKIDVGDEAEHQKDHPEHLFFHAATYSGRA